jgi:hypothetical protein
VKQFACVVPCRDPNAGWTTLTQLRRFFADNPHSACNNIELNLRGLYLLPTTHVFSEMISFKSLGSRSSARCVEKGVCRIPSMRRALRKGSKGFGAWLKSSNVEQAVFILSPPAEKPTMATIETAGLDCLKATPDYQTGCGEERKFVPKGSPCP